MAFDQVTRNRLQRFVSEARALLTKEFTRQLQNDYGIDPNSGEVALLETMSHLDNVRRETGRVLRVTLEHYRANSPGSSTKDLLERIVREQAFTVLNRLAALRMAEAREFLTESISSGYNSRGFQLYARLAGTGLGETGDAYRSYLFSLFDEFALDLRVLFDRFSTMGRLFPGEAALLNLLKLMNDSEIAILWAEDETIGWIYQYFNSKDERKKMRDESAAPRNSRELAVRNQFFTPRYVVEFLTDNTLGRIWYEMTQGETALKDRCRYLVRRPTEIFLREGAVAPESLETDENLSQEELLKQPVYIPYRQLKDPRELRMLDPACGSMHFGLYAFDLYECIYEEAWDLEERRAHLYDSSGKASLTNTYASKDAFLRNMPRLIIKHNIHGIDIDPRAVQIAGLSLWLRAQKSWQAQGLKPSERPQIQKSNIVCAEPMPGEERLLDEFIEQHLSDTPEQRLVGQLVRRVFEAMKLAGEAGSLLQIEQEISKDIEEAKLQWLNRPKSEQLVLLTIAAEPRQQELPLLIGEITDEYFWERVEGEIYKALNRYAEQAENGNSYQRRLFANDAVRGFAFIDTCRKSYSVVLMNPPFGDSTARLISLLSDKFPLSIKNLYIAFLLDASARLVDEGLLGAITDATFVHQTRYEGFRHHLIDNSQNTLQIMTSNGWGVLDSYVETASLVMGGKNRSCITFFDLRNVNKQQSSILLESTQSLINGVLLGNLRVLPPNSLNLLPKKVLVFWLPYQIFALYRKGKSLNPNLIDVRCGMASQDNPRFYKLWWEVDSFNIGREKTWSFLANGGEPSPLYRQQVYLVNYGNDGAEVRQFVRDKLGTDYRTIINQSFYYKEGLTFGKRTESFTVQYLPKNQVFSNEGQIAIFKSDFNQEQIVAYLNSSLIAHVLNSIAGQHKESGYVGSLPCPPENFLSSYEVKQVVAKAYQLSFTLSTSVPESQFFQSPWSIINKGTPDSISEILKATNAFEKDFKDIFLRIDEILEYSVGFTEKSPAPWKRRTWSITKCVFGKEENELLSTIASNIIGYALGTVFGRWDIRVPKDLSFASKLPNPLDALHICPGGMLLDCYGLPARSGNIVSKEWLCARLNAENLPLQDSKHNNSTIVDSEYPVKICWDGILVDDKGHPNDITSHIRKVLETVWSKREGEIEQEICEILGVDDLRNYFLKSTGFFNDHLDRYSRSNRSAPIYLPLSTRSGNYTLWLYYHRLTDQTLYTCINDYVEPKLSRVSETVNALRSKTGRSSNEEKTLENLQTLEAELSELRDELLRIARLPWKPNLNDGVQITVAPLYSLFRLGKWQKKLKETWDNLTQGDYDWAHLAYSIWTERVREKCRKDKSLAIAHGLEDLYEPPLETPKRAKRKKKD